MATRIDIGPYSAYAIAVKHGYTGSEESWAKLQIDAAKNAETSKENADKAIESAAQAKQAKDAAQTTKNEAEQSISDLKEQSISEMEKKKVESVQRIIDEYDATGLSVQNGQLVIRYDDADTGVEAENAILLDKTGRQIISALLAKDENEEQFEAYVQEARDSANIATKTAKEIVTNEKAREQAEQKRSKSEEERIFAENGRILEESKRVNAENDRVLSEESRNEKIAQVEEGINQLKKDIVSLKTYTDKYIIAKYSGSVITSKAPSLVLRYACQINKGDKVSIKSEYDGNNIENYDIRFYDASGNIHIIATSVPIAENYTFVAEDSYSEISIYSAIDNIVEGMRFTTIVSVDGIIMNDIYDLRVKQDVQSKELTNTKDSISSKYDKEYVNILDVAKAIANKCINADTGAVVDNLTGYWLASDFIKLNANTRYYCNGIFLNGIFGFYTSKDANTFVKSPAGVEVHGLSDLNYKKGYIETGSYEIYFRCSIASEMKDSAYISEWGDEYVLHQALPLKDFVHIAAEGSKLKGKKILVIGDSISTDYYGSYPKWVTVLMNQHYLPLDTVNDSIHATGFVADAGTTGNDFLSRLKAIENKSDFDLVIVFGGINDYSLYKKEENISDTFTNAVDTFFGYMVNNYANSRFGVIKPMLCNRPGEADDADKIRLYADYIATTAKKYAIPVLNMTDESGFNPFVTQIYERWSLLPSGQDLHDGIHPNEEFERKFMAPQIKHFIDGLI